ncbi:MAG TPA: hypothetical protein VJC12_00305 [Candidatus Paceibacterota bacterium]
MYLVFIKANARDTTVPSYGPCFVTEDPVKALQEARAVFEHSMRWFVSSVTIYSIQKDRFYHLDDFLNENFEKNAVFFSFWASTPELGETVERFFGDFKSLSEVTQEV